MSGKVRPNPFPGMSLMCEPTATDAYLLGLIWADGNIPNNNGHPAGVHLEIKSIDGRLLKNTVMDTGSWNYCERTRKTRAREPLSLFHKGSRPFCDFLVKHVYWERKKGAEKILAALPKNLRAHWLRGFFDGDGCATTIYKSRNFQLTFCGEWSQNWEFVSDILDSLGIRWKIFRNQNIRGESSTISTRGGRPAFEALGDFLYGKLDEYDGIGLLRKYKKFEMLSEFPNILGDLRATKYVATNLTTGRTIAFLSRQEVLDK